MAKDESLHRDPSGLLAHPEGGSLNSIAVTSDRVVKSYMGSLERGYEKLQREYYWLRQLPRHLRHHFAPVVYYVDSETPRFIELHLKRENKVALAKAILAGRISPERTADSVALALRILLHDLYPLRSQHTSGLSVYRQFHAPRVQAALRGLRTRPALAAVLTTPVLVVNQRRCPSFTELVRWTERHARQYFFTTRLVAGHGDAHLDNILTTLEDQPAITFVDPRGELLLPPHYDFSKMSKALRGAYDLIHYGRYDLRYQATSRAVTIDLAIDHGFDAHYERSLRVLGRMLPDFAQAEGVSERSFMRAALVSEVAHVVSFCWYHANHPRGPDDQRIIAFLAIAALMAEALIATGPKDVPSLYDRLL